MLFLTPYHYIITTIASRWNQVTKPQATVIDSIQRRQSQLLASLALFLIILYFALYLVPVVLGLQSSYGNDFYIITGSVALWMVSYRLSRSGHYRAGALIHITSTILIFLYVGTTDVSDGSFYLLYYLIIPILFTSIFFSAQVTLLITVLIVAVMIALPALVDNLSQDDIPVFFVVTLAVLITLAMRHRNMLEIDRQADLQLSEARYRALFEANSDAILVHHEGIIQEVNATFERLFNVHRDEAIGMSIFRFSAPEAHDVIRQHAWGNARLPQELTAMRMDGTRFPVEVFVRTYTHHGMLLRVVSIRDLTDRRQVEAHRVELGVERERVMLMKRFISDASHDLRTPLAIMQSSIYLLSQDIPPESRQRNVQLLDKHLDHLIGMVNDLLTVSRLDKAASNEFDLQPGDLNALTAGVIEEQRAFADVRNLHLDFMPAPSLPLVRFDAVELKRALRQLLTNATHYTPEAGRVTVVTHAAPDSVIIEVSDTGIGIAPEDQKRIFELFYRADPARQTDTGGMGLGLAICKSIIEAHGGTIDVESTPGEGSTFRITLPVS